MGRRLSVRGGFSRGGTHERSLGRVRVDIRKRGVRDDGFLAATLRIRRETGTFGLFELVKRGAEDEVGQRASDSFVPRGWDGREFEMFGCAAGRRSSLRKLPLTVSKLKLN